MSETNGQFKIENTHFCLLAHMRDMAQALLHVRKPANIPYFLNKINIFNYFIFSVMNIQSPLAILNYYKDRVRNISFCKTSSIKKRNYRWKAKN